MYLVAPSGLRRRSGEFLPPHHWSCVVSLIRGTPRHTRFGDLFPLLWVSAQTQFVTPPRSPRRCHLQQAGLGLRSATKLRFAVRWASWADTIKMVNARHPEVAERIIQAIDDHDEAPSIQAILAGQASLEEAGFVSPAWLDLVSGRAEAELEQGEFVEPNQPRVGWQSKAASEVESRSLEGVMDLLHDPQKALLRSQGGPLASAPFVAMPVDRMFRIESQPFRILLMRRLRQPLPLTIHSCRCGRLLDSFGHHWSACPVAGVLGTRGFPLENAAARVCREGGGRVRTNILVRDMDIGVMNPLDNRRLEFVVDGLPLFRGAHSQWTPHWFAPSPEKDEPDLGVPTSVERQSQPHGKRKERRYPELTSVNARAGLVGGFSEETSQFPKALASANVRGLPQELQGRAHAGWVRRWSAILGCTVARAFAVSLLDQVPSGADGPDPTVHEVLRDDAT